MKYQACSIDIARHAVMNRNKQIRNLPISRQSPRVKLSLFLIWRGSIDELYAGNPYNKSRI